VISEGTEPPGDGRTTSARPEKTLLVAKVAISGCRRTTATTTREVEPAADDDDRLGDRAEDQRGERREVAHDRVLAEEVALEGRVDRDDEDEQADRHPAGQGERQAGLPGAVAKAVCQC
jgi:hypothetical protein